MPHIHNGNRFKIVIFDLDDTLWDGKKLYDDTLLILVTLKKRGIKMYIASFNTDAAHCCKQLGINSYFEDILYGRNKTKLDMIKYISQKNPTVSQKEMIFFDDNFHNVREVRINSDVHAVIVGINGISWKYIEQIGKITIDENINLTILPNENTTILPDENITILPDENITILDVSDKDFHLSDAARLSRSWMKTITT